MIVATGSVAVAASCVVMGLVFARWIRRRRAKSPEEIERLRRLEVNRVGRITSGQIVDYIEGSPPGNKSRVVVYRYEVSGVTYEAAQEITGFAELPATGIAGLSSSVKYDPQKPMNSIIACEEWSGLMRMNDLEAAQP